MSLIVQKYGGTSVATVEKIRRVAARVAETRQAVGQVVVVVSAMGGATDELLGLARAVSSDPSRRELDLLLASGEQVSSSLLTLAIQETGCPAVALTGSQGGIRTRGPHGGAEVDRVEPRRIERELARGRVVVVAGFQGRADDGELTTLGRGGSDTTAVALAAALGAERCQLFSDVDGVYTADPRVVPGARRLESITHDEMQELARHGARVLAEDAVRLARERGVTIEAAATFGDEAGTTVHPSRTLARPAGRVTGVAGRDEILWLRVLDGDETGGLAVEVAEAVATLDVLHERPASADGALEIVASGENAPDFDGLVESVRREFGSRVEATSDVGCVTAVGLDLGRRDPGGVAARGILNAARIPSRGAFSARHSTTCLVPASRVCDGVRSLHLSLVELAAASVPARRAS